MINQYQPVDLGDSHLFERPIKLGSVIYDPNPFLVSCTGMSMVFRLHNMNSHKLGVSIKKLTHRIPNEGYFGTIYPNINEENPPWK